MSSYDLIDTMTCTARAYEPTYVFNIELSDLAIEQLKHKSLFGLIRIRKHESEFLSDLADKLSAEVLVRLVEAIKKEQAE